VRANGTWLSSSTAVSATRAPRAENGALALVEGIELVSACCDWTTRLMDGSERKGWLAGGWGPCISW